MPPPPPPPHCPIPPFVQLGGRPSSDIIDLADDGVASAQEAAAAGRGVRFNPTPPPGSQAQLSAGAARGWAGRHPQYSTMGEPARNRGEERAGGGGGWSRRKAPRRDSKGSGGGGVSNGGGRGGNGGRRSPSTVSAHSRAVLFSPGEATEAEAAAAAGEDGHMEESEGEQQVRHLLRVRQAMLGGGGAGMRVGVENGFASSGAAGPDSRPHGKSKRASSSPSAAAAAAAAEGGAGAEGGRRGDGSRGKEESAAAKEEGDEAGEEPREAEDEAVEQTAAAAEKSEKSDPEAGGGGDGGGGDSDAAKEGASDDGAAVSDAGAANDSASAGGASPVQPVDEGSDADGTGDGDEGDGQQAYKRPRVA